jgi:hypothetical protein
VIGRYNGDSVVCEVRAEAKETTEGPDFYEAHTGHKICINLRPCKEKELVENETVEDGENE